MAWVKTCRKLYHMLGFKYLSPVFCILLYTLFGGLLFLFIEQPHDLSRQQQRHEHYLKSRTNLVQSLFRLHSDLTAWNDTDLIVSELNAAVTWYENEINVHVSNQSIWDFWNALYYAGTIFTTIGYGDIACQTTAGRTLTMVYAFFGLPMMLMMLKTVGDLLYRFLFKCIIVKRKVTLFVRIHVPVFFLAVPTPVVMNTASAGADGISSVVNECDVEAGNTKPAEEEEVNPVRIPVFLILSCTFGWIFLCAAIFLIWEDWSYFESVYFFFISLTTIGFGDVVASRRSYMIMNFGLVSIGLSLVSVCIAVIQNELERLYYRLLQKLLQEYNVRLAKGLGDSDATENMRSMWQTNRAAKFLMPLLGKGKKASILQRFTNTAEASGLKVPNVLKDIDYKHGLPSILTVNRDEEGLASRPAVAAHAPKSDKLCDYSLLQRTLNLQQTARLDLGVQTPEDQFCPKTCVDMEVQCEAAEAEGVPVDAQPPADIVAKDERGVQTDLSPVVVVDFTQTEVAMDEAQTQTEEGFLVDVSVSTEEVHLTSSETQVEVEPVSSTSVQTAEVERRDDEVVTELSVPSMDMILKAVGETDSVATQTEQVETTTAATEPDRDLQEAFETATPAEPVMAARRSFSRAFLEGMQNVRPGTSGESKSQQMTRSSSLADRADTSKRRSTLAYIQVHPGEQPAMGTSMILTAAEETAEPLEVQELAPLFAPSMDKARSMSLTTHDIKRKPTQIKEAVEVRRGLRPKNDRRHESSSLKYNASDRPAKHLRRSLRRAKTRDDLSWNPRDGKHAEKQRPIRDLLRFYETMNLKDADVEGEPNADVEEIDEVEE